MRNVRRTLSLAAVAVAVLAVVPALYAQEPHGPSGSIMQGGMMGMGHMMGRGMSRMMDHCAGMMQGGGERPNEQWRNPRADREGVTGSPGRRRSGRRTDDVAGIML